MILVVALAVAAVALAYALATNLARPTPSLIVIERHPLIDQPAPDFRLATVDGGELALSELRGRPVILNFWATWCVPCREEFPLLRDVYSRYQPQRLEILGVIHDDGPQTAAAFAATYGATWPLLDDANDVAWQAYSGVFLPITFFIDRAGVVRAVSYGPPPSGTLEEQIRKIL